MGLLAAGLVPLLIVAVALSRAIREVDGPFVEEWARAHALTLTPDNRLMVHWYLRTARILRTLGVLAGLLLPPLISAALGFGSDVGFPVWMFLGYLVGALYAEVSLVRPSDSESPAASLVPRDLSSYLPVRLLAAQRILGGIVALGAVAVAVAPYGDRSPNTMLPHQLLILGFGVAGTAFAFGLERLQTWVVQRPQPFTQPTMVDADDAIRAQSVHSIAGSGLATLLILASSMAAALAVSDVQVLRWTMWVPASFGVVLALAVCLYYGHRAWRVRRPDAITTGPAPA